MKTFRKIVLSFCLLFAVTILSACGEAKVTEIYIQEDSIALTVEHNSTWSTDDIVVKAKLSNGKEKVVSDVEFSPIDTSIVGEQVLTVTYGVYEYKVTITVTPTILNYELKGLDPKVKHNSTIDLSGAYVQVTYSDSTQTNIYNGFTVTDEGTDTVGEHKYHLTFGNYQKDFTYNVVKTVSSIVVNGVTEDELIYGTEYDTTGITAIVTYSDDTTADLTNDKLSFTMPTNELGSQKLTVSYTDSDSQTSASQEFEVEVIQVLENITVEPNYENKTAGYHVLGEEFDNTQFKVYANYSKDKNVSLNLNDVEITNIPTASSSLGKHTITFTYNGKTTTIDIKIVESYANIPNEGFVVTSIAIDTTSIASSLNYNQDINLSNLVIVATYNNNPEMTARLNYSEYNSDITTSFDNTPVFEEGNTTAISTLSVTYKDLPAATCNITVNRVLKSLTIDEGFTTTYNYGDTFTLPTVYATYTDSETKYPVSVIADKDNITTPDKESFTDGVATVNVEYTYNYSIVDTANGGKNFVSHDITINDVVESINIDTNSVKDNAITTVDYDLSTLKIQETYVSGNSLIYNYKAEDNKYTVSLDKTTANTNSPLTATLNSNTSITNSIQIYVRNWYTNALESPIAISSFNEKSTERKNTYTDQIANTGDKGFSLTASDQSYTYKVGDDNPFKFSPRLKLEDTTTTSNYKLNIELYLNNAVTSLSSDELVNYAIIDEFEHTIDFKESAIGKRFKIKASFGFDKYTGDSNDEVNMKPVEFTVEVIDGWNAYEAKDLSLIDNTDEDKWTTLKTKWGFTDIDETSIKAIILHNDIQILSEDIPSSHFFTAKDGNTYFVDDYRTSVYNRYIKDNNPFNIEGNYFKIDASILPLITDNETVGTDDIFVGHITLLGLWGEDLQLYYEEKVGNDTYLIDPTTKDSSEESCKLSNVEFFGNAGRTDQTGAAGLICYKTSFCNFEIYNCLSSAWYIAHFFEGDSYNSSFTTQKINYCTSFDSYNSLIYCWAARNLEIKNSTLIGAGGPAIIADHVKDGTTIYNTSKQPIKLNTETPSEEDDVNLEYTTNITVDANTKIEAWVTGEEVWFVKNGASFLTSVLQQYLTAFNENNLAKGTLVDGKVNLIAAYKSGSSEGITERWINGTFSSEGQVSGLDFNNSDISDTSENMIFQSFTGAMIYPSTLSFKALDSSVENPQTAFASESNYLATYIYNGMGALLGFKQ